MKAYVCEHVNMHAWAYMWMYGSARESLWCACVNLCSYMSSMCEHVIVHMHENITVMYANM